LGRRFDAVVAVVAAASAVPDGGVASVGVVGVEAAIVDAAVVDAVAAAGDNGDATDRGVGVA
jgi:hypothetical protein